MGRLAARLSPGGQAVLAKGSEKAHALRLLRERGVAVKEVVRVDPYAVSFLNERGEVHTAWMTWVEAKNQVALYTVPGLPAFP